MATFIRNPPSFQVSDGSKYANRQRYLKLQHAGSPETKPADAGYTSMMPRILRNVPCRLGAWNAACLLLGTALTAILPGTVHAIGVPQADHGHREGEVGAPAATVSRATRPLSTLIGAAGGYTDNADLHGGDPDTGIGETRGHPLSHPRLLKGSPRTCLLRRRTLRIPTRTPGAPDRTRARSADYEPFTRPNDFGVTGLFEPPPRG